MNPKIEQELVEFKEEIEEKYWQSETVNYVFKRIDQQGPKKFASIMKSS